MELNSTMLRKLNDALQSAYPILQELKMMVRFQMNERLDVIAPGVDLAETVFQLTQWADREGRLDELIKAAYRENPANRQLAEFVEQYEYEKDQEESGFKHVKRK